MEEKLLVSGWVTAELFEGDDLVGVWETHNFVTDVGLKHIAEEMGQQAATNMGWIAVGTGTGQTRASIILATDIHHEALEAGYPDVTASPADNVVVYKAIIAAGDATDVLTEGGVFNNASVDTGTLLNYWNFTPPIDKSGTQSLTITLSLEIGNLGS